MTTNGSVMQKFDNQSLYCLYHMFQRHVHKDSHPCQEHWGDIIHISAAVGGDDCCLISVPTKREEEENNISFRMQMFHDVEKSFSVFVRP